MDNLSTVPKTGTFGGAIDVVNGNFELVKNAVDQIDKRTNKFAGFFQNAAALQAAVPSPTVGMWADVGASKTVYVCNTSGSWTNSGETDVTEVEVNYNIVDNLESTSTSSALSANQGRVLKEAVDNLCESDITDTSEEKADIASKIAIGELDWTKIEEGLIYYSSGNVGPANASFVTDYINVVGVSTIIYARGCVTNDTSVAGMAFYDSSKMFISGQRFKLSQPSITYNEERINVPNGAAYARFTILKNKRGFYARDAHNPAVGVNRSVFATDFVAHANTISFRNLYVTEGSQRDYYTNNGKNAVATERLTFNFVDGEYLVLHQSTGTFEMVASNRYSEIGDKDIILGYGSTSSTSIRGGELASQYAAAIANISNYLFSYSDGDGLIYYVNGNVNTEGSVATHTNYVVVRGLSSIYYARMIAPSTTSIAGMAFYDTNKNFISGERCSLGRSYVASAAVGSYEIRRIEVPSGAAYARFTMWKGNEQGFFIVAGETAAGDALYMAQKSYDKDYPLLGKKVSIIGDSISCDGTETQTRESGYNAPYYIIQSIDVGTTIESYITWLDVYTYTSGTTPTGKTIGGVALTPQMIGTKQSFTPNANDVGKALGVPRWASKYANTVWWKELFYRCGAELLNNASWSGSSICKVPQGNTRHDAFVLSEAYSDYTIDRLSKRNPDGTITSPDVVIIYRGTNDFSLTDGNGEHESIETPNMITWTGIDDEMNFTQCYITTIEKIRVKYPNAYIILCTLNVFKRGNYAHYPSNNGVNTLPDYNNKIREIANLMGCGLVEFDKDGITFENVYPDFCEDSATEPLHPNGRGHRVMADKAFADINYTFCARK